MQAFVVVGSFVAPGGLVHSALQYKQNEGIRDKAFVWPHRHASPPGDRGSEVSLKEQDKSFPTTELSQRASLGDES